MSEDITNMEDDDFDLDSLDFDFDNPDEDYSDREPLERIKLGALDALNNKDNQVDFAKTIARNSIPDSFRTLGDDAAGVVKDLNSLYDDAKKDLKDPLANFKEELGMVHEAVADFLPDSANETLSDFFKADEGQEKFNYEDSVSKEDAEVAVTLANIFGEQAAYQATVDGIQSKKDDKSASVNIGLTSDLLLEVRRQTAFQQSIDFNYKKKSLEVQQWSLFALRDLVNVTKAMSEDNNTANKQLVENTALPDFAKINLMEGYKEQAMEGLFGKVTDSVGRLGGRYASTLKENAKNRLGEITGDIGSGLEDARGMISMIRGMIEGVSGDPLQMAAEMATEMGATSIAGKIGSKIQKMLNKNPVIAKHAKEIEFFMENYPTEINELLSDWDGRVFPERATQRFPFLERINASVIANELNSILPDGSNSGLTSTNTISKDMATTASPYTSADSKALREIIPGYLSRILEQATIANQGEAERLVFDMTEDRFNTLTDTVSNFTNRIQGGASVDARGALEKGVSDITGNKRVDSDLIDVLMESIRKIEGKGGFADTDTLAKEFEAKGDKAAIKKFKSLTSSKENKKRLEDSISKGKAGIRREVLVEDLQRSLKSGMKLDPVAASALEEWLTFNANSFKRPKVERLEEELEELGYSTKISKQIMTMMESSKLDDIDKHRALVRASNGISDENMRSQEMINTLQSLSGRDIVDRTGIYDAGYSPDTAMPRTLADQQPRDFSTPAVDPVASVTPVEDISETINKSYSSYAPSEYYEEFSILKDNISGIPVHIMSGLEGMTKGLDPDDNPSMGAKLDTLASINEKGFLATVSVLDAILQKDSESKVDNGGLLERLVTAGGKFSGAIGGVLQSYIGGVYNLASSGVGAAGKVAGGALNLAGNTMGLFHRSSPKKDVYMAGDPEPVITAKGMKRGDYTDGNTGKVIKDISDITGPVYDKDGNLVLSEEQARKPLFNKDGFDISSLTNLATKPLSFLSDIAGNVTGGTFNLAKAGVMKVAGMVSDVLSRPMDIYVTGNTYPSLTALVMRNGGYFSETTGKPVMTARGIDGQVLDANGNILVTHEDISKGLIDVHGQPIAMNAAVRAAKTALRLARNIAGKGIGAVKAVVGASVDMGKGVLGMGSNVLKGAVDLATGNRLSKAEAIHTAADSASSGLTGSESILSSIFNFMQVRWPISEDVSLQETLQQQNELLASMTPKKVRGDSDGDGVRDNSLSDIMSRSKNAQSAAEGINTKDVEPGEEEKKTPFLLNLVSGIAGTLTSGLSTVVDVLSGIGGTLLSILAASKIGKGMGMGGGDVDLDGLEGDDKDKKKGRRRSGKGKAGIFGKVKSFAGSAFTGMKAALSGPVAKQLGKRALAAGAALLSPAAAPVIAAAAAAYTAYEIYDYFTSDDLPTGPIGRLERLRHLQYGLKDLTDDETNKVRLLEKIMTDNTNAKSQFKMSPVDIVKDHGVALGLSLDRPQEYAMWESWFNKRFAPIFLTHHRALQMTDNGRDVQDVAGLDETDIASFLALVNITPSVTGRSNPYLVMAGPFGKAIGNVSELEISEYFSSMMKGTDSAIKQAVEAEQVKKDKKKSFYEQTYRSTKTTKFSYTPPPPPREGASPTVTKVTRLPSNTGESYGSKNIRLIMPCSGVVTSPYGMRVHPIKASRKMHKGVDIADAAGTPIMASADGVIYRRYRSKSYGLVIYIKHPEGHATRYAHMSGFASGLSNGDKVKQGQTIGYMGNTGISAGSHLHWELRVDATQDSRTLDPLKFVNRGKEAKRVKTEEKKIRSEGKGETADKTLEGHNTMGNVVDKEAKGYTAPKSNVSLNSKTQATTAMATESTAKSMKDLTRVMADKARTENDNASNIKSIADSNKRIEDLMEKLVEIVSDMDALAPPAAPATPAQATIRRDDKKTVTPVVDLSR